MARVSNRKIPFTPIRATVSFNHIHREESGDYRILMYLSGRGKRFQLEREVDGEWTTVERAYKKYQHCIATMMSMRK